MEGEMESCLNEYRASVLQVKKVQEICECT